MDRLQKLKSILAKILEYEEEEIQINLDSKLVGGVGDNDLNLSSIDYVEFVVEIEKEFDIIYDFNIQISTIKELLDYIDHYSLEKDCKE